MVLHSSYSGTSSPNAPRGGFIVALALVLIIAHGLASPSFVIDSVTLGLLALASVPYLSTLVTSLKAGGVELAFRDLSVYDQVVTFLEGIATKRQWTFFS